MKISNLHKISDLHFFMCEFDIVQTLKFWYMTEALVWVMSVKVKIERFIIGEFSVM